MKTILRFVDCLGDSEPYDFCTNCIRKAGAYGVNSVVEPQISFYLYTYAVIHSPLCPQGFSLVRRDAGP